MASAIDRIQAEVALGNIIKRLVLLSTVIRPEDLVPLCDNLHSILTYTEGKINIRRKPKTLTRKMMEFFRDAD